MSVQRPSVDTSNVPKDKRRYLHPENQREINLNTNVLLIAVRGLIRLGISPTEIHENVDLAVGYEIQTVREGKDT